MGFFLGRATFGCPPTSSIAFLRRRHQRYPHRIVTAGWISGETVRWVCVPRYGSRLDLHKQAKAYQEDFSVDVSQLLLYRTRVDRWPS